MSKSKNSTWFRNTLFALIQPFLPPVGILPTIIHEAAHWLTAFLLGVPTPEIRIELHALGPGVSIPLSTPPEYLPYFFYSGGLTSGTILLMLYVFYWARQYRHNTSTINWIMSMLVVFSITIQFYLGILEGRYYNSYSAHINQFQLLIFILAAFACHIALFYLVSHFRKKRA